MKGLTEEIENVGEEKGMTKKEDKTRTQEIEKNGEGHDMEEEKDDKGKNMGSIEEGKGKAKELEEQN